MSQSNKIVRDLLRLITPDEISELTKIAGSKPKIPLTELVVKELQSLREHSLNKSDYSDEAHSMVDEKRKEIEKRDVNLERDEKKGLKFLNDESGEPLRGSLFILSQKEKHKCDYCNKNSNIKYIINKNFHIK